MADPDEARDLLLAERSAAQAQARSLSADVAAMIAASEGSNSDDEHDPEGATIAFERAQTQALEQAAERRIDAIDAALERLDDGRYGECLACGQPIAPERLAARPTAERCVACALR